MLRPQDLGDTLANDDAGSHGVAGGHPWHDRAIRHTKVADSIDVQMAIHHRQGISAHLGRAGLMPVGYGGIADEAFELCPFQVAWHHLAPGEGAKRGGVADLSAQFHAGSDSLQIVWVRQKIGLNLDGVERIGPHQKDTASAFGPDDATE
jgi:hypothetical protein